MFVLLWYLGPKHRVHVGSMRKTWERSIALAGDQIPQARYDEMYEWMLVTEIREYNCENPEILES